MNKKKKRMILIASFGGAIGILALIAVYVAFGSKYRNEFYPNTVINGIDCSNMTAAEAEETIKSSVEDYSLELHFRRNKKETISGEDFDYSYVPDGSIQAFLDQQNIFTWLFESGKTHTYTLETAFTYDEQLLAKELEKLPELQTSSMTAPKDAYVKYKNTEYVVVPARKGTTLDPSTVLEAVKEAITNTAPVLDLDEADLYTKAAIQADDPLLAAQVAQLNELANAHITYTLPDTTTVELTPEILQSWLTQKEDGSYVKEEEKFEENLRHFLEDLKTKTDNSGSERLFDSTMDGTVSVPYGSSSTYVGYQMDLEEELTTLKTQIDEHQVITREPLYLTKGGGIGNHGLGGTYVDLNLSRQHLWYYKDGVLVFDTNIVSGTMTTWRYTPPGWYKVAVKSSPHTMKGEIDPATKKPIYIAECTFWMNFIPSVGIGFHDYTSRGEWSPSTYLYNGSHGCINMLYNDAKTLYNLIEVGTPVVAYYSEPYSLRKELSPAERYAQNPTPSTTPTPTVTETPPVNTPPVTTPPATNTPSVTETPSSTEVPTETPSPTNTPEPETTPESGS